VQGGLAAASKRVRLAVLAAGPGANLIVGFVLLVIMCLIGTPELAPGARVVSIAPIHLLRVQVCRLAT